MILKTNQLSISSTQKAVYLGVKLGDKLIRPVHVVHV